MKHLIHFYLSCRDGKNKVIRLHATRCPIGLCRYGADDAQKICIQSQIANGPRIVRKFIQKRDAYLLFFVSVVFLKWHYDETGFFHDRYEMELQSERQLLEPILGTAPTLMAAYRSEPTCNLISGWYMGETACGTNQTLYPSMRALDCWLNAPNSLHVLPIYDERDLQPSFRSKSPFTSKRIASLPSFHCWSVDIVAGQRRLASVSRFHAPNFQYPPVPPSNGRLELNALIRRRWQRHKYL